MASAFHGRRGSLYRSCRWVCSGRRLSIFKSGMWLPRPLSLSDSSRFGVLRYDIWNDTVTDENKKRGEDKKCRMDAFVVKVHEETSKGTKRLYLYPLFLYTIKKSGKYFTLHTSVNFLFQLRNRNGRTSTVPGGTMRRTKIICTIGPLPFWKGKNFREDSLCVIAAGVRQGEINRRKSSATNIMRIMQV